jgi:hypothetical protein
LAISEYKGCKILSIMVFVLGGGLGDLIFFFPENEKKKRERNF